jgi:hypothetical protein
MAKRSRRARLPQDDRGNSPRSGSRARRDVESLDFDSIASETDDIPEEETPVKRRRRKRPVRNADPYDEHEPYEDQEELDQPPRRTRSRRRPVRTDEYAYDDEYDNEYEDRPPVRRSRRRRPIRDEEYGYDDEDSYWEDRESPPSRTRRQRPVRSETEWEEDDFETSPTSTATSRRKSSARAPRTTEETPSGDVQTSDDSNDPPETASDASPEAEFHFFRTAVFSVIMLLIFGGAWRGIHNKYEPEISDSKRYDLKKEDIHIFPEKPFWILDDILEDTYPKILASMRPLEDTDDVSLLEDELCQRAAKEFEGHHWVTRVTLVQRRPNGLYVELKYRRPACMVLVPGGLVFVDGGAIFLPEGGFISTDDGHLDELALMFPLLVGVDRMPNACLAGTEWRDIRVQDGARIASELGAKWLEMRLKKIIVSDAPEPSSDRHTYHLVTNRGSIIQLGTVQENPPDGMADLETKIQYLIKFAEGREDQLDRMDGQQEIDLRRLDSEGEGAVIRPIDPTPPPTYH